jgi:hypothetical protein
VSRAWIAPQIVIPILIDLSLAVFLALGAFR